MNKFILVFLILVSVAFSQTIYLNESFSDSVGITMTKRTATACNNGDIAYDATIGDSVWNEHISPGGCCEQRGIGWYDIDMGIGTEVYHRFYIKYGDGSNAYSWSATGCSEWGHEYKFPDIYAGDQRVIVKHGMTAALNGFISVFNEDNFYYPPRGAGDRNYIINAGTNIINEKQQYVQELSSNIWYYFEMGMIENGANDTMKVWVRAITDTLTASSDPDWMYAGALFTNSGSSWDVWWNWGFKNHGYSSQEEIYFCNFVISDSYIGHTLTVSGGGSSPTAKTANCDSVYKVP